MVQLRILDILKEQQHTKYWLCKQMEMPCYRNLNRLVNNETTGVKFETLNKLCRVLDVPVGELFEQIEDTDTDTD